MEKQRLKIAETYIKLDLEFDFDRNQKLEKIFRVAVEKSLVNFKYKEAVIYKIEFEKGSTKAKVIFFSFLNGIIFYADLKDSINSLYNDVKYLSELVIMNAKQDSELIENNIIRTERRTGIFGRLNTALARIDYIEKNLNNLGNNQIRMELNNLKQEISNLLQLLKPEDQQEFLNALPIDIRNNFPEPNPNDVQHFERIYAIKPEDE